MHIDLRIGCLTPYTCMKGFVLEASHSPFVCISSSATGPVLMAELCTQLVWHMQLTKFRSVNVLLLKHVTWLVSIMATRSGNISAEAEHQPADSQHALLSIRRCFCSLQELCPSRTVSL